MDLEVIAQVAVAVVVIIIGIISIANKLYYARENGKILETKLNHHTEILNEIKENLKLLTGAK